MAVLLCTVLSALAHDSHLFKNLEKDVEDEIIKLYDSTNKQGDCRPETREGLEKICIKLSTDGSELYDRSWNKEENEMRMDYNKLWKLLIDKKIKNQACKK